MTKLKKCPKCEGNFSMFFSGPKRMQRQECRNFDDDVDQDCGRPK